jgi:hypothetical protein
MNTGAYWTKQEELQLMDELSDQRTMDDIAKIHGRTPKAIEMRIESLIRKQHKDNYTISSLVNLYHKTESEIHRIIETAPPPPPPVAQSPVTATPKRQQQKPSQHGKSNIVVVQMSEEEEQRWKKIEDRLTMIEKYVGRTYKILSSFKKN